GAEMATLATPVEDLGTLRDPNAVKLVRAASGDALYFSRAPVPWPRDAFAAAPDRMPEGGHRLRHTALYGCTAGLPQRFAPMPLGGLEQIEALEQLRGLEAGLRIAVGITPEPFPRGVDTPEDLERAEARISANG